MIALIAEGDINMSILFLLKEHGSLTFDECFDITGSAFDEVELMTRLKKLEEAGKIKSFTNKDDLKTYCLIKNS